ncbi:hypothetical protein JXB31_02625 [Candidatus Woesearchaeota archaeon]|nr:hypothetical protein [Candidatus Woesearchaeota archaeon]
MKLSNLMVAMAIAVMLLFLSAASCTNSNRVDSTVASPYYGGYEGLIAEFEEVGSVSDTGADNEVWEDEAFPIRLHMMNKGEYKIPAHDVKMEIKGIAKSDFTGIDFEKDNDDEIEKVSEFLPDGGETYVDFGEAKYQNMEGTFYDANIYTYFEYPYRSYINIPKVCYKENLKDTTVCVVDENKQAFASGGPIQVGTVKERYIGKGKILLEIPIKNVQKGYAKAQEHDDFRPEWDEIYFEMNDMDWECQCRGNHNVARITHPGGVRGNEEVIIVCTNKNLEEGAKFTKAVTLVLSYYYQDWVDQVVRIRENPE